MKGAWLEIITNYVDLCRKIDNVETQLFRVDLVLDYWFWEERLTSTGNSTVNFGVIASVGNIQDLHDKKNRLQKMLQFYQETKKETESKYSQLEGLNYKIARMRYLEDKSYKQIADELNMTYGFKSNQTARNDVL